MCVDLENALLNFNIAIVLVSGSPRVEGDEEEDDIDDIDNEFEYGSLDDYGPHNAGEGTSYQRPGSRSGIPSRESAPLGSEIPLLTYGEEVISFSQIQKKPGSRRHQKEKRRSS